MCDVDYAKVPIKCKHCGEKKATAYAQHPVMDYLAFECKACFKTFSMSMYDLRKEHVCSESTSD
jgi:hypothetical protein